MYQRRTIVFSWVVLLFSVGETFRNIVKNPGSEFPGEWTAKGCDLDVDYTDYHGGSSALKVTNR